MPAVSSKGLASLLDAVDDHNVSKVVVTSYSGDERSRKSIQTRAIWDPVASTYDPRIWEFVV